MEYGRIERELQVDASPAVVFEVISSAGHLREWWPDDALFDAVVGGTGSVTFGAPASPDAKSEALTVVEVDPPHRFAFRWVYDNGPATPTNSLLVTFDLIPSGDGTLLRFSESGFRERGWEVAVLEQAYLDHARGWDVFLPRLATYSQRLVSRVTTVIDDALWSAVGDPTRRRMLDRLLADGGGTATTLSEQLPVTRQAVAKHLGVLDRVGLVHGRPVGREHRYEVDATQLARAVAQLSAVGTTWDARLQRIKRIAERIQRTKEK